VAPSSPIGAVPATDTYGPDRTAREKPISGSSGDPEDTRRRKEVITDEHLRAAAGEHARWQCFYAAGLTPDVLVPAAVGPVMLETTIRYLKELRAGDEFDVSCRFLWGTGKTFQVEQDDTRIDGTPVARVTSVAGLLDRELRRLVPDPAGRLRSPAADPAYLGR
jgi:acyl-CoA thioester hydrolase